MLKSRKRNVQWNSGREHSAPSLDEDLADILLMTMEER
jgi:hypothetical protein